MFGRRPPWSLIALAVVTLLGGLGYWAKQRKPPLAVEVVRVERGEVRELIPSAAAGQVKAARRVTVRAETTGTIVSLARTRGERVKKGERVLELDPAELEVRISQAEANVEAALVAKKIAVSRADSAQRSFDRAKKLEGGGVIPKAELEKADSELEALKHAVEQAGAAEKQAQAALRLARLQRERTIVTAPFDGVLFSVEIEVGGQVTLAQPLFELLDDSAVVLEIPVDEADADRIHVDQEVVLHQESTREHPELGKVSYVPPAVGRGVVPAAEAAMGKRDRSVYVEVVPGEPGRFRIGASVNAEFLVGQKKDVLFIPSHVVIGRGLAREVYVVEGGKAKRLPFKAGLTSWERTEVTGGLEDGQSVIASLNLKELADGVRVRAEAPAPDARAELGARPE